MESREFEDIRDLFLRIKVAHHINGRVRLKLSGKPPSWLISNPKSMQKKLENLQGVLAVDVNILAGSATVQYDSSFLSPELFEELKQGNSEPILAWIKEQEV